VQNYKLKPYKQNESYFFTYSKQLIVNMVCSRSANELAKTSRPQLISLACLHQEHFSRSGIVPMKSIKWSY